MAALSLEGHRYGALTVLALQGKSKGTRPEKLWACRCDCGQATTVRQNNLRSGHTQSCGCQVAAATSAANKTHGRSRTDTYVCWCQVKARCTNPNNPSYARYGGRGIQVCERWLTSFENFLDDMGEKPGKQYSIERVDNSKGYEPSNCKWATRAEQARNYSRNVFIEYEGRVMCLRDWANELQINHQTLRSRLKNGWSVDAALNNPVSMRKK